MNVTSLFNCMEKDYILTFNVMLFMREYTLTELELIRGVSITRDNKGFNKLDTPFFHDMVNKYNKHNTLDLKDYKRIQKRMSKYKNQIKNLYDGNLIFKSFVDEYVNIDDKDDMVRHGCNYGICDECPYQCSI